MLYSKSDPGAGRASLNDALYGETGSEEQKRLSREMELRLLEMHWFIWGTECNANWPWVKGYNGELKLGIADFNYPFPYLWIDQDLKKQMGY